MVNKVKYYGGAAVGEKGQIIIPAEVRKKFGIETGDQFLVIVGEQMGAWGIVLLKGEMLSLMLTQLVQNVFGGELTQILEDAQEKEKHPREPPNAPSDGRRDE
jgi:AbrB family looped-hinge helix DNA binding protein